MKIIQRFSQPAVLYDDSKKIWNLKYEVTMYFNYVRIELLVWISNKWNLLTVCKQ